MKLPHIKNSERKASSQITEFKGINLGDGYAEGEFSQMVNMSSRQYPTLSPRMGRGVLETHSEASALFAWNKLIVADGTNLYDGEIVGNIKKGDSLPW